MKKQDFVVGVDTGSTYHTHPLIDLAGPTKKPVTTKPTTTTAEIATTTTVESSTSGMLRFLNYFFNLNHNLMIKMREYEIKNIKSAQYTMWSPAVHQKRKRGVWRSMYFE